MAKEKKKKEKTHLKNETKQIPKRSEIMLKLRKENQFKVVRIDYNQIMRP